MKDDMRSHCFYCEGEPEPGRIETPNNGPIVDCPVCSATEGRPERSEGINHSPPASKGD